MKVSSKLVRYKPIKIIPNYFLPLEYKPKDIKEFKKVKKYKLSKHFYEVHYKRKKQRINKFINRVRLKK